MYHCLSEIISKELKPIQDGGYHHDQTKHFNKSNEVNRAFAHQAQLNVTTVHLTLLTYHVFSVLRSCTQIRHYSQAKRMQFFWHLQKKKNYNFDINVFRATTVKSV